MRLRGCTVWRATSSQLSRLTPKLIQPRFSRSSWWASETSSGPDPFRVEADRHGTNLFLVLVGETSRARKGTSLGHVRRLLAAADPAWGQARITSGLSSGEGLIWAVRDPNERGESAPGTRAPASTGPDPGVNDKRLLVIESEFASPLRAIRRDGNTLSPLMRQAWDDGTLRTLTKNAPAVATGAHISLIGHITREELIRHLDDVEAGNGFANRFLWACVRRARLLPEGGRLDDVDLDPLVQRLRGVIEYARTTGRLARDTEATELWKNVYPELSEGRPGLLGAVTSRAEAQTMRLALIYALLDASPVIGVAHLEAALALWAYCDASCRHIFGTALGDPVADALLAALGEAPAGLTRTEIRDKFDRHLSAMSISRALRTLEGRSLATCVRDGTGGRPAERWLIGRGATNAT